MIDSPFKIVLADLSSHTILYVDVPTGKIMSEIPYPASVRPAGAILTEDRRTAYIPAVNKSGKGILFALNLESISLYQLPVDFPSPIRFCLAPGSRHAYLADTAGALYALDLASLAVKQWGHMPEDTGCAGIAASDNSVYTVWECAEDGAIAIFNRQGELTQQIPLQGKPTYVALTPQGKLLVAHTAGGSSGEGIDIIDTARCGGLFHGVTIVCRSCRKAIRAYPSHIALSPDGNTAYVVNEDSATISLLDIGQQAFTGCISAGRSLSQICLSPDGRFAVGASNMFAELSLIDLNNERLLSVTNTDRELSGFVLTVA